MSSSVQDFIREQKVYFVGTCGGSDTKVNVSPKGMDSFRVMDANRVCWLNLTGSGNETAAHILENPRMTIMFCAFEGKPVILRLYGQAKAYHPHDKQWQSLVELFPNDLHGARQIIDMKVEYVQKSCGMGVPLYDFNSERDALNKWAENTGQDGIKAYWQAKNKRSIDDKETGMK